MLVPLLLLFTASINAVPRHEPCRGYGGFIAGCDAPLKCVHRSRYLWTCEYKCPGGDWECTPNSDELASVEPGAQCGGKEWQGPTRCIHSFCQKRCDYYSECRLDCPEEWQCSKRNRRDIQIGKRMTIVETID